MSIIYLRAKVNKLFGISKVQIKKMLVTLWVCYKTNKKRDDW